MKRTNTDRQVSLDHRKLIAAVKKRADFGLTLVSAKEIRDLNRIYRGKNRPTDVLSFPAPAGFVGPHQAYLGEVLICLPVARAQAREHGHALRDELRVLMVHGLLHLLGYDHEQSPREEARMRKKEAQILKKLRWSAQEGLISRANSSIKTKSKRSKT